MSSAPKRGSQEEGGHLPSSSVRPTSGGEQEESHAYPRANYGPVQENRPLPRIDSRDGERRSPLPSVYRMPSVSMTDTHASNPAPVPEVRPDSRDSKEGREIKGVEVNREVKVESRDVHHQSGKVEKESRSENRMDESKEVKYERDRGNDSRSKEVKVESRDVHHQSSKGDKEGRLDNRMGESKEGKYERDRGNAVSGVVAKKLTSWKYLPEHRVKGNPDAQGGESWNNPHRVKGIVERNSGGGGIPVTYNTSLLGAKQEAAPKDVITIGTIPVMKERVEGNETVGENRVDLKADDKHKDSKREEGKSLDRPESEKDKSDYRSNLPPGSSSNNDFKETTRELKESECRDRERKDIPKEKERIKEREKDRVDKEGRNCVEKEGYLNDKSLADKPPVQENLTLETKKPTDSWRNLEREAKERRKERDGDVEGERPEKRRCYEKEPDEGVADVDGGTDKERDGFSSGVQQKKRMLRARGSPQVGNRDARFKSRGQDAEGSQGKPEFSTGYKVGECLQELTKLWKEYESAQVDKNSDNLYNGPTLEIRIPAEHVTATNRQVRGGQLWGTDIYTDDSDLVAVLMHTGYCRPTASPPPTAIQELRATIRVLPPQDSYVSTLRNNVRSRAWGAAIGCSYRVERCCIMKKVGGSIVLEPCLTQTSTIEPTLAPVTVERTMTTRAAASNALKQQRFVREVTIQYNLCNEPWTKYSISIVADKGLKKPMYTSARLKKGEVLYLETHFRRYELCFSGEKIVKNSSASQIHEMETGTSQNHGSSVNGDRNMADGDSVIVDMFRWSRCKKPLPQNVMRSIGIPLPLDHVEVLEENIDWEDVQWSQTGVWIAGKEYQLARVHFMSPN